MWAAAFRRKGIEDEHDKTAASGLAFQNLFRRALDHFGKSGRFYDDGVAAPAKNPALDFLQARQFQAPLDSAISQFDEFLGIVPPLFADVIGHQFFEAYRDLEFPLGGMDAEAVAQTF